MAMTRARAKQITYKSDATGAAVVNLHDKLGEMVSVKDFGAVGDGVVDERSGKYLTAFGRHLVPA